MAHAVVRLMAAGALLCAAADAQPDPRVAVLLPESGVPGLPAAIAHPSATWARQHGRLPPRPKAGRYPFRGGGQRPDGGRGPQPLRREGYTD